jgi:hypothetical protein
MTGKQGIGKESSQEEEAAVSLARRELSPR